MGHESMLLRLASEGTLQVPLSLWSTTAFVEHLDQVNLLFGGNVGIMLLLMPAALASYLRLRDRLFAFYALLRSLAVVALVFSLFGDYATAVKPPL